MVSGDKNGLPQSFSAVRHQPPANEGFKKKETALLRRSILFTAEPA
jgi:hypothetical protein